MMNTRRKSFLMNLVLGLTAACGGRGPLSTRFR
jgi:predicted small lipoprotein YifL